jgi:predicted transcriptional regulator
MKRIKPSDLELQVLGVLWDHGPLGVRDVLAKLPDGKERAYTTVLSVLQSMEQKKFVTHARDGLTHIYEPLVDRQDVAQPVLKTMMQHLFSGDPAKVVQALIDGGGVTADELKQIRKVINEAARKADKGSES